MTTPHTSEKADAGQKQRITIEQIRAQYARNSRSLAAMANKAEKSGKKVNGYTASELREKAAEYAERSAK